MASVKFHVSVGYEFSLTTWPPLGEVSRPLHDMEILTELDAATRAFTILSRVCKRFADAGWKMDGEEDGRHQAIIFRGEYENADAAERAILETAGKDFAEFHIIDGMEVDGEIWDIDAPGEVQASGKDTR